MELDKLKHPLTFKPIYRDVLWGGSRIARYKNVDIDSDHVGESWEMSVVPGRESVVADESPLRGHTLKELAQTYGSDLLGTRVYAEYGCHFPLLLKIIDATADISVQVHPDDELAARRHNSQGKAEMWYVLDAAPDARIYCGLCAPMSPDDYSKCLQQDTILDFVASHPSAPGQFYYVPAGTIHAIGAGNLLIEVQQSCDITYRVYDFNRRDSNGLSRQLHTDLAKDAIDYTFPRTVEPTGRVYDSTTLRAVDSPYFITDFIDLSAARRFAVNNPGDTFYALVFTDAPGSIFYDGQVMHCPKGGTVLMPACLSSFEIEGSGHVLLIHC